MFRSQYDGDATTFSPQGRLHQVEYALEAVKQGSATVGAKSKDYVVLTALKRAQDNELCSHQGKIFKVDAHAGMSISGMTSDGRYLARYMRTECMNHRYVYDGNLPVRRLVTRISDKAQGTTQRSSKRPFGVGMLVAGVDKSGPCLFETRPDGEFYSFMAYAIGARSQSARTYLERHFKEFDNCSKEELVTHALSALATTCSDGVELNTKNTTVAIVGRDQSFTAYDEEDVEQWLALIPAPAAAAAAGEAAPMETDGDADA